MRTFVTVILAVVLLDSSYGTAIDAEARLDYNDDLCFQTTFLFIFDAIKTGIDDTATDLTEAKSYTVRLGPWTQTFTATIEDGQLEGLSNMSNQGGCVIYDSGYFHLLGASIRMTDLTAEFTASASFLSTSANVKASIDYVDFSFEAKSCQECGCTYELSHLEIDEIRDIDASVSVSSYFESLLSDMIANHMTNAIQNVLDNFEFHTIQNC